MNFRMQVRSVKNSDFSWWEDYNEKNVIDIETATKHSKDIVEYFNSTLVNGQPKRELLSVELGGAAPQDHNWEKMNSFTREYRGRIFDVLRCSACGITAKRYELTHIIRDKKWRAKKWKCCQGSLVKKDVEQ